jgi:hypothetical protein
MEIDFSILDKNPLDLIVEEKKFAKRLKEHGVDGNKIKKILQNLYGLSGKIPILKDQVFLKERKKYKSLSYSMSRIVAVLRDPLVSEAAKAKLDFDHQRLRKERENIIPKAIKITMHPDEEETKRKAKSFTQVRGFQVVDLYEYIHPFLYEISKQCEGREQYKKRDIFKLIAELFNVTEIIKQEKPEYDYKDIETLYFNNIG